MTKQLSLFPDSPPNIQDTQQAEQIDEILSALNPVDEAFAAISRFRNSSDFMQLMRFIARFPNYSAYNGLMLFIQNPSVTYVATARTWAQKFGRRPKIDAQPLVILAPMAPVLFVFDILDTEGAPVPSILLKPHETGNQLLSNIYATTRHNCNIQKIAVHETSLDRDTTDTANRITPVLRKKYKDLNIQKDTSYLILVNQNQNLKDKFATLVHELGHIFCSHLGIDRTAWWPERSDLNIGIEDIEANAVAYLVCRRIGMLTVSEKYLSSNFEKTQAKPIFSLNAVLKAVTYIEEMGKRRWKDPLKHR
jgi:hypothetical protein